MTNLTQMKNYIINTNPSSSVFVSNAMMTTNKRKLKMLSLLVNDRVDNVQNLFQSLQSASSLTTLNSLDTTLVIPATDPLLASVGLIDLCNHLNFLTHLRIRSWVYNQPLQLVTVFVEILQNLLLLENLEFECCEIHESDGETGSGTFEKIGYH